MKLLNRLPIEKTGRNGIRANQSDQGIMLVECLVYLALLFVFLGLTFSLFYTCWDDSRGLRRNADDIISTLNAGELWREDIRAATSALRVESSEKEQILHIPQKAGEVVYRFTDGLVQRKANDRGDWIQLLTRVKSSRMQLDKREQVKSWSWEVELKTFKKSPQTRPLFSFHAVPPSIK